MTPIFLQYPEVTMGHISTIKLHKLRYGELSDDEQAQVHSHLAQCDRCTDRLSAQENHRAAFELMPVPDAIANIQPEAPSLWRRLLSGYAVAPLLVAALALFFINPAGLFDADRKKGNENPDIEVLVEALGDKPLVEGEAIRPGDRIQLRIPPGEWVEVWVGDGEDWLGSFPVHPSHRWELVPFSLTVDEAPGPERIVVVLANHPIDEEEAFDALSDDDLGGIEVQTLVIPKEL